LGKFKNYLALGEKNLNDEQNRLLVLSMTIKCAGSLLYIFTIQDVGHGAKSLELHKLWSRRIIEEFFR
jgi:3',5'-cyclic-nucleotide phosphodiesterase/cAMP-specific phosphodiesterase 4